jgi:hypothetical protein
MRLASLSRLLGHEKIKSFNRRDRRERPEDAEKEVPTILSKPRESQLKSIFVSEVPAARMRQLWGICT